MRDTFPWAKHREFIARCKVYIVSRRDSPRQNSIANKVSTQMAFSISALFPVVQTGCVLKVKYFLLSAEWSAFILQLISTLPDRILCHHKIDKLPAVRKTWIVSSLKSQQQKHEKSLCFDGLQHGAKIRHSIV